MVAGTSATSIEKRTVAPGWMWGRDMDPILRLLVLARRRRHDLDARRPGDDPGTTGRRTNDLHLRRARDDPRAPRSGPHDLDRARPGEDPRATWRRAYHIHPRGPRQDPRAPGSASSLHGHDVIAPRRQDQLRVHRDRARVGHGSALPAMGGRGRGRAAGP